jgi:cell division protein FtsI (penicillin-binding protein 3)
LFPADKPQYVVLVKLDSPKRAYYGGEVAAPVSAVILRAALAARDAALDRGELAAEEKPLPVTEDTGSAAAEMPAPAAIAAIEPDTAPAGIDPAPYAEKTPQPARTFELPFVKRARRSTDAPGPVPDVAGLSTRNAVRALHKAGFRVTLSTSQSVPSIPSAGSMLPAGSIVKLRHIH